MDKISQQEHLLSYGTVNRILDELNGEDPDDWDKREYLGNSYISRDAIATVKTVPSAQPSATDTNVGGNLIDRQAALDALNAMKICRPLDSDRYVISDCMNKIAALSFVQPEPLTDKEQRIFLAAMGREEKVCKQVDDECRDCREPYEDSLVRTCHEIVRKVKGALWT